MIEYYIFFLMFYISYCTNLIKILLYYVCISNYNLKYD